MDANVGMMSKKKAKIINGIIHKQCIECNKWYVYKPNIYRCKKCQSLWIRKYREKKKLKQKEYRDSIKNTQERIDKELAGKIQIDDLYDNCSLEEVLHMQTGNVNEFLRAKK